MRKLCRVVRAIELATGFLRHIGEQTRVDVLRRIDHAWTEESTDRHRVRANADGVDLHVLGGGQVDGLVRIQHAGVVDAVGEQDQHALVARALLQALDCEPDRIADRGLAARQPDCGFVQLLEHGVAVESQRCEQVRLAAKHDQADAIADTAADEVPSDGLDRGIAVHRAAANLHVRRFHAAGCIHRQQQIAPAARHVLRRPQPLWTCRGAHQQNPTGQRQPFAPRRDRRGTGHGIHAIERIRQTQGRTCAVARRWQQARRQPGQREQHEQPWPGEFKHARLPLRAHAMRGRCA